MARSKNSAIVWYSSQVGLSRNEMVTLIRQSRHYRHEIRKLKRAAENGRRRMPDSEIEALLGAQTFITLNAIFELHKRRKKGRVSFVPRYRTWPEGPPQIELLREEAQSISRDQLCVPVRQRFIPKPSGGERLISEFCTIDRARQMILRDVVDAINTTGIVDYSTRGAGRDAAIREIFNQVENGFEHWAILDIRNAFPSIKPSHVMHIVPLRGALMSIACVTGMETPHRNNPVDRQLPQGGLASQSILSAIVGREVRALRSECDSETTFVYSDNLWVGARSREVVERHLHRLTERFRTLAGGPLELREVGIASLRNDDRLTGLGYSIRRFENENRYHIGIGNKSFIRFKTKLRAKLDALPLHELYAAFEEYRTAWLSSFPSRSEFELAEVLYRSSCEIHFNEYLAERIEDEELQLAH